MRIALLDFAAVVCTCNVLMGLMSNQGIEPTKVEQISVLYRTSKKVVRG